MARIRCISLWQPWASLVATGIKSIETRSKPAPRTIIGARIAIHAAKTLKGFTFVSPALRQACLEANVPDQSSLPFGSIIATAYVEASIPTERLKGDVFGDFSPGRFGWMLADIRPLPEPISWRGSQGIFFADIDLP